MSNILRYGLTNQLTANLSGQRVGAVLDNAGFRGALGFTANVQAKINGVAVNRDYAIRDGETIDIETQAQQKAANVTVNLRHGPTNSLRVELPEGSTVNSVLTNRNYRAALGFGDGSIVKVNGAVVTNELRVTDGMTIDIETGAQQKAS